MNCARLFVLSVLLLSTAHAAELAIVNVNVITMTDETVLPAQTVLISNNRIEQMGPVSSTVVPTGAAIVDGTDRYLMPGLSEMHGHVPGAGNANLERVLTLYVANGVTSVRGMLGQPSHLKLRERIASGKQLGPRLYTSGPSFNGNSVSSPRQAADMVRAQQRAGYDFLKIHPGLTRAEFTAMAEAAAEHGIRFAGHVPEDVGVELALQLGISTIDHLDGYLELMLPAHSDPSGGYGGLFGLFLAASADPARIPGIARATAEAGTWNVPTESLFEHYVNAEPAAAMAAWPEMKYMPAATVRQWAASKRELQADRGFSAATAARAIELRRALIKALHEAGAGLLLGSDAPQVFNVPGFSIHRELEYLVAAGLSPFAALQTGTVNAARWFGQGEQAGTVAVGQPADLVLLDDNPLADIANSRRIHGVVLRGEYLGRGRLDELLAGFARQL
jgi:imidazolonepropionase-like amidohydrolase